MSGLRAVRWLTTAMVGLAAARALEVVQPQRADGDPLSPAVVWVGADAVARKAVVNAGYVCVPLPVTASAADIQGTLRLLRSAAAANHIDSDRVALFADGDAVGETLKAGLAPDPGLALSALGALGPLPASQLQRIRSLIRSDSPALFLTDGQELARTLTDQGVANRIEGRGAAWRRGLIEFLHNNLGYPAHGLPPAPPIPVPRREMDLDLGWRFYRHDTEHGADLDCDDSKWGPVDLPHTWNAQDGEDGGANYYRGPAWYRRHVKLDSSWQGKQLYLQFDGAAFQADVYVNGKKVGSHLGGFARFRFDATDSLQTGDNVIAVRVDNSALGIPPTSADFTFFGGLYRSVSLIGTDPVQISTTDYGSDGVFVDQTLVTAKRADIFVRTDVENYQDKSAEVDVLTAVYDADGQVVARDTVRKGMGAGDAFAAAQKISFERPHLWNGRADPYLYTVLVTLRSKGRVRDAVAVPLGLRSVQADPDRGFLLNGQHLDLHGVNRHQDRVDKGWAISAADEAEDFSLLSDLGCTVMRTSHYQQSQTWYDRCDHTGIVVWTEIPFVNQALPDPSFLTNAKQQLHELILQNYNHPSICFWGVGNETRGVTSDQDIEALAELAKTEDGSRLTTLASNESDKLPKNWHTDFTGFNHYSGWYQSSLDEWPSFLDGVHQRHPRAAIGISEYGAGASIYEHQLPPKPPIPTGRFHPEEYQAYFHERVWPILAERPFVGVKLIWCLFDFASDGRSEGDHLGRNDKGLVTYSRRTLKDAYYYYQANWSARPVVALGSRRFLVRHETGTAVKVYSNAHSVELFVNGRSLGERTGSYGVFEWPQVRLISGGNTASAVAHFGGETVTDGATWICEPSLPQSGPSQIRDTPARVPSGPASAESTTGARSR